MMTPTTATVPTTATATAEGTTGSTGSAGAADRATSAADLAECRARIAPLADVMAQYDLDAVVLRRAPNVAWATGGRVHVALAIDAAIAEVVITAAPAGVELTVVTNAIEAPRLREEELPPGLPVVAVPWWEPRSHGLPATSRVGSDSPRPGEVDVAVPVERIRQHLTAGELERYRVTARRVVDTVETVLPQARPSLSEQEVAGMLSGALAARGLECLVLLVAGDERRHRYRHPLPSALPVGPVFFASVCARERGLICSVTRAVAFRALTEDERRAYRGLLAVEARLLDGTVPGRSLGEMFTEAMTEYGKAGPPLAADEWWHHHQGGPTGYLPRDWPVTPQTDVPVLPQQAFAWNPTGGGFKVEDTVVSSPEGGTPLAISRGWPTVEVAGRQRPDILTA